MWNEAIPVIRLREKKIQKKTAGGCARILGPLRTAYFNKYVMLELSKVSIRGQSMLHAISDIYNALKDTCPKLSQNL